MNAPASAAEREFPRAAEKETGLPISAIMRDGGFAETQKQIGEARLRRAETETETAGGRQQNPRSVGPGVFWQLPLKGDGNDFIRTDRNRQQQIRTWQMAFRTAAASDGTHIETMRRRIASGERKTGGAGSCNKQKVQKRGQPPAQKTQKQPPNPLM